MKPYIYLAKTKVMSVLAYRFDVISSVVIRCLVLIATSFFWVAAYGNRQSALGVTKEQMLTYSIMSAVLSCLLSANVEDRVIKSVRKGSVALDMLKPVNIYGMYLAEDIGSIIVSICQNAFPLFIIASLLIQVPVPSSGINFLLFLLSVVFSYMINWLIAASFSMLTFFLISMGPLIQIKINLIRILSGSIIPLWFFPQSVQTMLNFLPFVYLYQLPLSIYIGKLTRNEIGMQLGLQVLWIFILYLVFKWIQKKVLLNVLVQGG